MRDLGLITWNEPAKRLFTQGMVIRDGAKMSKNKGNTIGADEAAEKYGADIARIFCLFAAPPERTSTGTTPVSTACTASWDASIASSPGMRLLVPAKTGDPKTTPTARL